MVRVISVHHFLKQEISAVDEVIDVATVPPDTLLLIQSNHTISVRNLTEIDDPGYFIPAVDQISKIVYSVQGNYIGTLENKITRSGNEVAYVRIYMNWESLKNGKECAPTRARIAGRVTPLSQNHQGLEMIEIPLLNSPDNLACCPISGNLLISSKNILTVYKFVTLTHDISKICFIDFEQMTVDLELKFAPSRMQMVEDMIAVQNDEFIHVFRMKSVVPTFSLSDREFCIDDCEKLQFNQVQTPEKHKVIDYEKLLKESKEMRYHQLIETSNDSSFKTSNEFSENESSKVNQGSLPIRHDFQTVLAEKSQIEPKCTDIFRQNPFAVNRDLTVNIIDKSSPDTYKNQYKIVNILQYQLTPVLLGSTTNKEMQEKFTCLILKPFYVNNGRVPGKRHGLQSVYHAGLKCVACFFGTQQEGYLHSFEYGTQEKEELLPGCSYTVYPFTAPVIDVQLEDAFVHTLTDTGLETYTMRAGRHLTKSDKFTTCPSSEDPICLAGLRPFVNVLKMSITSHYLTLFANNEESSLGMWTLYELHLPDPASTWLDILTVAEENKWEAPSTYSHLVGEGHLILKTYLNTVKWAPQKDKVKNSLQLAAPVINENETTIISGLYKESCALLGDFHILYKEYDVASKYYTMGGFKIPDTIKRIEGLYDRIPSDFQGKFNEKDITRGLIVHLKKILCDYDEKYSAFTGNREEFYNPEIGHLVTVLMDLVEKEERTSVSDLVLGSIVLREFSTDRILKMMKNLLSKSSVPQDKDALSLALMCIQRGQNDQAKTVLLTMTPSKLEALLVEYSSLLFEKDNFRPMSGFTELSVVLIEIYPQILGNVLSLLVTDKGILNLSRVLKIFLDILPSGGVQSRNSSLVLQIVLENYLKSYHERFNSKKYDYKTVEALKILIRIYLSHLQQISTFNGSTNDNGNLDESKILFHEFRPNFLNYMPPFGPDLAQLLSPQHGSLSKGFDNEQKINMLKIQSLLSNANTPEECIMEVRNFISKQSYICGSLSLQALCSSTVHEIIQLLLNFAPQALVHYAKEKIKERSDWKVMVTQLQNKINGIIDDNRRKFYYQQILSEILHHVAENLSIEDLIEILPKDCEDSERYLGIAQNSAQANHIRTLIMVTGKQLLASL